MGDAAVETAAQAAVYGRLGVREVLEERDPFALLVLGAAVERAREIQDIQDQNLAVRIINVLAEAMKKG